MSFFKIDFRERGKGWGERDISLLFHLIMHSLVDCHMYPDQGWNPQPWCMEMTLTN